MNDWKPAQRKARALDPAAQSSESGHCIAPLGISRRAASTTMLKLLTYRQESQTNTQNILVVGHTGLPCRLLHQPTPHSELDCDTAQTAVQGNSKKQQYVAGRHRNKLASACRNIDMCISSTRMHDFAHMSSLLTHEFMAYIWMYVHTHMCTLSHSIVASRSRRKVCPTLQFKKGVGSSTTSCMCMNRSIHTNTQANISIGLCTWTCLYVYMHIHEYIHKILHMPVELATCAPHTAERLGRGLRSTVQATGLSKCAH